MTKGKIIGYIGIVLIIIITVFLGTKYYLYTNKNSEVDKSSTEIEKYTNLVCSKMVDSDNYSKNSVITMAFDNDNLVWLKDDSYYYYFDKDEYTNAKEELSTTNSIENKYTYYDDNRIINTTYESEIEELKNSEWSIDVDTYTYDMLSKYYQEEEYTCK